MIYKKGDFIGQKYEVFDVLGMGGCGIVYLVYSNETESVYALKTFRDEYLEDDQTRERFKKECQVWIDLERHPYLVRASFVVEISGRLFIAMEYIAPDEQGLNSLEAYLRYRPPDLAQSLSWAIQFCHGMEYAYSKGIKAHRDIKPANILIGQDKAVKISDFGLAGVIGSSRITSKIKLDIQKDKVGFSCQTMEGTGFGTPTHMPPEQFINAAGCDEISDIYSFGIVLYQMASNGRLPFLPAFPRDNSEEESMRFWREMHKLHCQAPIPKLSTPLFPIIFRCLEKNPINRYFSFKELRRDLEVLCKKQTGEVVRLPEKEELEVGDWLNKGFSLSALGKHQEAIDCYNKALEINPNFASAWSNKGSILGKQGRYEEELKCYDRAIEIDPKYVSAWYNKGNLLGRQGRFEESLKCLDRAIEIDPNFAPTWHGKGVILGKQGRFEEASKCFNCAIEINQRDALVWYGKALSEDGLGRRQDAIFSYKKFIELASVQDKEKVEDAQQRIKELEALEWIKALEWINKGVSLYNLGKHQEAMVYFDRSIEINPRDANAWNNKGAVLLNQGSFEEALKCYDHAIEINPRDANAWNNKGAVLLNQGRYEESLKCLDRAIEINPNHANAWYNKGVVLGNQGSFEEALKCYDRAIEIDPNLASVWYNKGNLLGRQGRFEEALKCYDRAIEVNPNFASAWYNKAFSEDKLGQKQDAIFSYKKFIELASVQHKEKVEYARKRLKELA